jgi:hypothetical protein
VLPETSRADEATGDNGDWAVELTHARRAGQAAGASATLVYSPPIPDGGLGMLGLRDYSVSAGSLRRLVLRHLELDRLEDAPVGLHVVAADALSGEKSSSRRAQR